MAFDHLSLALLCLALGPSIPWSCSVLLSLMLKLYGHKKSTFGGGAAFFLISFICGIAFGVQPVTVYYTSCANSIAIDILGSLYMMSAQRT